MELHRRRRLSGMATLLLACSGSVQAWSRSNTLLPRQTGASYWNLTTSGSPAGGATAAVAGAAAPTAQATTSCEASCQDDLYFHATGWTWRSVHYVSTFTAATLFYVVNTDSNRTVTSSIVQNTDVPSGFVRPATNANGTRVATFTLPAGGTTVMAYPTSFFHWGATYGWHGRLPTTDAAGRSVCSTATGVQDVTLHSQPQPAATLDGRLESLDPSGNDFELVSTVMGSYGNRYRELFPDQAAFTLCSKIVPQAHFILGGGFTASWFTVTSVLTTSGLPPAPSPLGLPQGGPVEVKPADAVPTAAPGGVIAAGREGNPQTGGPGTAPAAPAGQPAAAPAATAGVGAAAGSSNGGSSNGGNSNSGNSNSGSSGSGGGSGGQTGGGSAQAGGAVNVGQQAGGGGGGGALGQPQEPGRGQLLAGAPSAAGANPGGSAVMPAGAAAAGASTPGKPQTASQATILPGGGSGGAAGGGGTGGADGTGGGGVGGAGAVGSSDGQGGKSNTSDSHVIAARSCLLGVAVTAVLLCMAAW